MKRQIIKYTELLLTVIFAFLLWQSADRIIQTSQTESWWQPILFFSLFFISWSLGAILIKNSWLFFGISTLALLIPLFFTTNVLFFGVIILAEIILWMGRRIAQDELSLRIKISIWNSLRLERRFFVFAIALILTGQYYFGVNQLNENKTLPEFKISRQQAQWTTKILSRFDPSFKNSENIDSMTVDNFILSRMTGDRNDTNVIDSNNIFTEQAVNNLEKQVAIEKGRASISKMVERKILGNEKIVDIFSEIINNKINNFANVNVGYIDQNIPIMHWVFTTLLFLSIVSIGMFISPLLIMLTWLLFKIMVSVDFISIDKKTTEVEIIK